MSAQANEPCPCGSGLTYGRCHGSIADPASAAGNVPLDTSQTTVSLVGFAGTYQTMHLINRFKGEDPRNALPREGAPGLYEVTFVLGRPGFSLNPEGQISFSAGTEGDSHLAISKPAFEPPGNPDADRVMISGNTADGEFTFLGFPNKKGFLGKLVTTPFRANTRQHAEEIAYRAISSSLSDISLNLDIPLDIARRETKELVTGNVQLSLRSPYSIAPLAINPTSLLIADYRNYASLYREAMITNSPVFEYLCLFKIIEALQWRRRRLGKSRKEERGCLSCSFGGASVLEW